MGNVDLTAKIPNNVALHEDKKLQRALEKWQPEYIEWWQEMGPSDFADDLIYLHRQSGPHRGGRLKAIGRRASRDELVENNPDGVNVRPAPFRIVHHVAE